MNEPIKINLRQPALKKKTQSLLRAPTWARFLQTR
jgi:hypothetical protein